MVHPVGMTHWLCRFDSRGDGLPYRSAECDCDIGADHTRDGKLINWDDWRGLDGVIIEPK